MADNTTLNAGTGGDVIATDDLTTLNGGAVSGVKAQRVKVGFGSDASFRDVDASNGLPVSGTVALGAGAATIGAISNTSFAATQATAASLNATVTQGPAAAASGAWTAKLTDGTNTAAVKAASTAAAAADPALVVQLNPAQPNLTTPLNVAGAKTNNSAAPGANNVGALPALANAAVPSWTEGNQVAMSADLAGALRVAGRPPVVTGAYRITVTTAGYAGLAAGAILASFRYGATGLCIVTRVRIYVTTSVAATAAGRIDRALFVVRGFTVADSAGTAITLTGNVAKLRTSHASTGVANIMVSSGAALTAGTGTQDANPIGVVAKQGTATEPVGLTLPAPGTDSDLFAYNAGQNYPIVLAQNEGLRVTIPTAMPTSINQISAITFEWYEVGATSF
jgi:hypothetical protein